MRVFISWSGERSRKVGLALHDWLPNVLHSVKPWMSEIDIDRGSLWFGDLSTSLDAGGFGILCMTRDNLLAPWLYFEEGCLCKSLAKARVCPYLLDVVVLDLEPPLRPFNAALADKNHTHELVQSINRNSAEPLPEERVTASFDKWWGDLNASLQAIRQEGIGAPPPSRPLPEMIEEILGILREQERRALDGPSATIRLPANVEVLKQVLAGDIREPYREALFNWIVGRHGKLPPPPFSKPEEKQSRDAAPEEDS
jgi:hypothetical protein